MTEPFPILDLPRELRDRILFYICGDQNILISLDEEDKSKVRSMPAPGPPIIRCIANEATRHQTNTMKILLISRQLAVEAARIVYSTSLFCFRDPKTFLSFVASTSTKSLGFISKMSMNFNVWYHKARAVWEELINKPDSLSQLKTLSLLHLKLVMKPSPAPGRHSRLPRTFDDLQEQEVLRSSKALHMLKLATIEVEIQRNCLGDPDEHALRHMKEMRDFVVGQTS